jgi:hypothetical protein
VNRLALGAALVIFASTTVPAVVQAQEGYALSKVAADLGYKYAYLGPEDAITLSRPGVTILIRPGNVLFDVNDRTESMQGSPPVFDLDEVYVSESFVDRLRQIAAHYPAAAITIGGTPSVVVDTRGPRLSGRVSGAVSSLAIAQAPGQFRILVDGKAPANLPITITLVQTPSKWLPDVVLSRSVTSTDADGRFHADISAAPGWFTGSIISVTASSVPGITTRTAQIVMKQPNENVNVPADNIPREDQP